VFCHSKICTFRKVKLPTLHVHWHLYNSLRAVSLLFTHCLYLYNPNGLANCRSRPKYNYTTQRSQLAIRTSRWKKICTSQPSKSELDSELFFHLKFLSSFDKTWITNNPKMFWLPPKLSQKSLECFSPVPEVTSLVARPRSHFVRSWKWKLHV